MIKVASRWMIVVGALSSVALLVLLRVNHPIALFAAALVCLIQPIMMFVESLKECPCYSYTTP